MDFEVFLSPEALSDLEGLGAYIASRNPAAADLGNCLLDTAVSLTRNLSALDRAGVFGA